MKVKKFKNLWTMGLILFGVILIALYVAKIFFPEFIVGIAEIEGVVKFGEYVDTHLWAYYLFTSITSFVIAYFYCCACCRRKYLETKHICIIILEILLLFIVERYLPQFYVTINILCMVLLPAIICLIDKKTDIKYFYSTTLTLSVHLISQILSLQIRDIGTMISYYNSATYLILLVDMYIWQVLLYNYFNYKERI